MLYCYAINTCVVYIVLIRFTTRFSIPLKLYELINVVVHPVTEYQTEGLWFYTYTNRMRFPSKFSGLNI